MNKLVSVVIPVYNAEDFIIPMIDSILLQSYANWELILVDDFSTDNSLSIMKQHCAGCDKIHIYAKTSKDKKGGNASRNIGLSIAKGEYICFFDADDIVAGYCLENRVRAFQMHSDCDFVVTPAISFKHEPFDNMQLFGYNMNCDDLNNFIASQLPFVVVTNTYKTASLLKNNIFWDEDLKCYQDSDFNMTVIYNNLTYAYIETPPDYFWRIYGNVNSVSKLILSPDNFKSRLYFFNKIITRFYNNKHCQKAILLRSYFLYKGNLGIAADLFEKFMDLPVFADQKVLRLKLNYLYQFFRAYNVYNHYIVALLIFIFCPVYSLRPLISIRIWNYKIKHAMAVLNKKYNAAVQAAFNKVLQLE